MKTMTLPTAIALAYDVNAGIYDIENPRFDIEVGRERRIEANENVHQAAERCADQLSGLGLIVYVRRFGTGNAHHSGYGNNGVERIEVRGWSITGKGIRSIRKASRIVHRDASCADKAIDTNEALALWKRDVVSLKVEGDIVVLTPRMVV